MLQMPIINYSMIPIVYKRFHGTAWRLAVTLAALGDFRYCVHACSASVSLIKEVNTPISPRSSGGHEVANEAENQEYFASNRKKSPAPSDIRRLKTAN